MFEYFLLYYPSLKHYRKLLAMICSISYLFVPIILFVVIFGNLALQAYFKSDVRLILEFIDNLPIIIKILFIYSCWFYVVIWILIIISLFFTPTFARAKNHHIGKILMEVKWQRWRFSGWIYIFFLCGFLAFFGFSLFLKLYAFGLFLLLLCWWRALKFFSEHSFSITENGILVGRTFGDVFIPYEHLYPLSEKDMQREVLDDNTRIIVRYDKGGNGIMYFDLIVKNGHQVRQDLMNFYNEKVKEFRENQQQDSINAS